MCPFNLAIQYSWGVLLLANYSCREWFLDSDSEAYQADKSIHDTHATNFLSVSIIFLRTRIAITRSFLNFNASCSQQLISVKECPFFRSLKGENASEIVDLIKCKSQLILYPITYKSFLFAALNRRAGFVRRGGLKDSKKLRLNTLRSIGSQPRVTGAPKVGPSPTV